MFLSMQLSVGQRFEGVSRVIATSNSTREFCENLVHDETLGQFIHGVAIYEFDRRQSLFLMDSYGKGVEELDNKIDLWSEHPISKITRDKQPRNSPETGSPTGYLARVIPIAPSGAPTGSIVMIVANEYSVDDADYTIGISVGMLVSRMFQVWRMPGSSKQSRNEPTSIQDLTSRQLEVLALISDGLTNAEIARQVLLSESSVRQETIKIYRALGVSGRKEAMVKDRELELIETPITPPLTV